jgi:hypothetical protein
MMNLKYQKNRNETRTDVTLKTILNTGEELPKITLNIKDFERLNWIADGTWNFEPRISPNGNNKEYFKDTSKILSKLSTEDRNIVEETPTVE